MQIAKPGIEGFYEAVLPRATGHNVGGLRPHGPNPLVNRLGDELGPIIGADMAWDAPQD